MEKSRIQKLLLSEYKDFSDMVLIESPFAETTRNGRGLREVALALTSSELIIAADILRDDNEFICPPDLDPSIETLELVSVYPLHYVNLSIFRRRRRKTLKARLIDGRANYFELGGMNRRQIFWSLWCEHIQTLLAQKENGSSLSETTAASSSSASTSYFLSSDVDEAIKGHSKKRKRCICRLWAHYGGAGDVNPSSWTRKDIYMGPSYCELGPNNYFPLPIKISRMNSNTWLSRNELPFSTNYDVSSKCDHKWSQNEVGKIPRKKYCNCNDNICDVLFIQEHNYKRHLEFGNNGDSIKNNLFSINTNNKYSLESKCNKKSLSPRESDRISIPKLSRFGFGVEEKCAAGLYLPPYRGSRSSYKKIMGSETFMDPYNIIESGVALWEQYKWRRNSRDVENRPRHFRRYGLAPAPHFLYALGPWSVADGDKISIQSQISLSSVNIRRQPAGIELRLPISKRQLTTSVSMTSLEHGMLSVGPTDRGQVILFWTPKYWYRPRAAIAAYRELRQHLDRLRDFQQTNRERSCRKLFTRKSDIKCRGDADCGKINSCNKATCILNRIFLSRDGIKRKKKIAHKKNTRPTDKLRNLLKMNLKITAWDLDSTTFAKQLTLIDRNIFLRIPVTEIKILIYQKSSRNAPNIGAFIAFSHRISCLITSELLIISKVNMRARILARFINAANKCFAIGNFQSCRSILAGLQSPAIYRLKLTWSYLKTHHSTNYEMMSKLCKIFKNPRTQTYKKAWENAERCPPLIPYIGDIFIRVLGLDKKSNSFCECSERKNDDMPPAVPQYWDGGATFLTQNSEQKNDLTNSKITSTDKIHNNIISNKVKKNKYYCKRETEPIKNRGDIIKKFFVSTSIRLRYGKYTPIKSSRKNIFWAAKQLILARKYYEHWQTIVMTARIIAENEKQRKALHNEKRNNIQEVTTWFMACQRHAQGYDFPGHSLAWDFLLKARYREERENFVISRKLEPVFD